MKRFASAVDKLADIVGYLSGWLVPLMMMLVVVDVFMRYVMQRPLMVADELTAYMLVALSFLGFAYTWRQGGTCASRSWSTIFRRGSTRG